MSSLKTNICNELKKLDMIDVIILVLLFIIFIYIIRTYFNQNSEFFNENNDIIENEFTIDEDKSQNIINDDFNFIEISNSIMYPKNVNFSCTIAGQIFYLGYVPSGQCISNFDVTEELHTIDCTKYNIVLELLKESKEHKNTVFNISKPSGSKKYDYMIGTESIFNNKDYVRLSSDLLGTKSITNLCGDVGIGTHDAWNVNIIQRSIGINDIPPTFNLCFVVDGEIYYTTYAEENIEPCFFNYIKNNISNSTILHKAALTKDKFLALNFIISEEK